MEIIKMEQLGHEFGIVLQKFEYGYELVVSSIKEPDRWIDEDGIYSNKYDGLRAFTRMKKEYKNKQELEE